VNRLPVMALALSVIAAPPSAHAQLYPVPVRSEPTAWVGLGVGAFNASEVFDGKAGSEWDFGNRTTPQYRLSLERALRGQTTLGLLGSYVRAPIIYRGSALEANSCAACDAEVDVYSLYALFHAGGGPGFHQVVEGGLGVTSYQNFRRESDDARLEPLEAERDLGFLFAYGFGYTVNPRLAVNLVQEYGMNFHESRGAPSGASNTLRFYTTRLAVRMGLGGASMMRGGSRRR
jgi:hypothetical protein